jgi:ABC-type Zn uptake system ZnuABC Zn-binding protein ZnuA
MHKSFLIGLLALLLVGAALPAAAQPAAPPTVVATHAVLGEFAQVVGGNLINVVTIIPSGFCPAHYDLKPSDLAAVTHASLVLYSGFEPWMDTLLSAVGNADHPAQTVALSGDWNTPKDAEAQVDALAAALTKLLPQDAATFQTNAAAYKQKLAALGQELLKRAQSLHTSDIPVVVMAWQAPFVSWLGFPVVTTYGVPENLSLKDLVKLTREGKEGGAKLVIDNLQSGVSFGAKLAYEIGAIHVVLSNFPGAMPNTGTVLDLFKGNAENLFSALAAFQGS